jgi:hypothetical protein
MTLRQLCCLLAALLPATWLQAETAAQLPPDAAELNELAVELAQLQTRLTRLRDHSDIEKLQRSFGYYVDRQQWQAVRDLFSSDGVLEPGGRGRFVGQDSIHNYLLGSYGPEHPQGGPLREYPQLQGVVTLQPDGRSAEGRWSSLALSNGDLLDLTYENDYVKENGSWKLRYVRSVINMRAALDSGWATAPQPNSRPDTALPTPDLPPSTVYLSYPGYYNEPFHYPNPVTGRDALPPDPAAGAKVFPR